MEHLFIYFLIKKLFFFIARVKDSDTVLAALLPHTKKSFGLNPVSGFRVGFAYSLSLCAQSGYSGILLLCKDIHEVRLIDFKLAVVVNVSVSSCLSL